MPLNHNSIYAELTDCHFKLIGKIVVEWSNIEFLLGVVDSRINRVRKGVIFSE